jgi:uncharacterized membrane protein YeaQ/YmgE (transglycosylase-associated protein family)
MTPTGIILTILIGVVVGVLGRLVVPGRQPIGFLVTVLVGIVAAFIGAWLAPKLGVPTGTSGPIDWILLLVQVVIAAIGVALAAAVMGRRSTGALRR